MTKLSTTELAKNLNVSVNLLLSVLLNKEFIYKEDKRYILTPKGEKYGGELISQQKLGVFIVWPPDFDPYKTSKNQSPVLINTTAVGKHFKVSSQRMNLIFAEIGWTEKAIKGWNLTSLGEKAGGLQFEHFSGGTYVLWPEEIIKNKTLIQVLSGKDAEDTNSGTEDLDKMINYFRTKFPASLRTRDGHMVRSKAEVIIDNALYDYGLAHAYERKLPMCIRISIFQLKMEVKRFILNTGVLKMIRSIRKE